MYIPQNLKNISKLSFTRYTSSLPLWRGWYFFTKPERDFLPFPPCSGSSKDAHELLTKTQFKCGRPSPCTSVFMKKPLLLENSGTTPPKFTKFREKIDSFPFVLPQRPAYPRHPCPEPRPESSKPRPVREQGADQWGGRSQPDGGAPPRVPLKEREENHLMQVSLCSDLRPCIPDGQEASRGHRLLGLLILPTSPPCPPS